MKNYYLVMFFLLSGVFCAEAARDYFTETFEGDFDLEYSTITFTPNTSENGYSAVTSAAQIYPVATTGHEVLNLGDENFVTYTLTDGKSFPFFGVEYTALHIGSNGYVSFDTGLPSGSFYSHPMIAMLNFDLDPTSGTGKCTIQQYEESVVISFNHVERWASSEDNTFQLELFFDGTIRITWLEVESSASNILVGLSDGDSYSSDWAESDLSEYRWDADGDGLPDEWERNQYGGLSVVDADTDTDGDGMTALGEYIAGCDPNSAESVFRLSHESVVSEQGTGFVLTWEAVEGRVYTVRRSDDLVAGSYSTIVAELAYPVNAYTAMVHEASTAGFYRVEVSQGD